MKLATLANGTRDGVLVVVSRDLTQCTTVGHIASTLQAALDDWDRIAPRLQRAAEMLEHGAEPAQRFREHEAMSPLPRPFQLLDGSAFLHHVELTRRARDAAMPESLRTDPLMYQGGTATLGPREAIRHDPAHGIDFEAEIAVVTGDVERGGSGPVRLLMLMNDVSLRRLVPEELPKGFGFVQSKPPSAFSPVAVTPDELGDAWDGERLSGTVRVDRGGRPFGRVDAGIGMQFGFSRLVAHASRTRPLGAGTIVGSGTVSNTKGEGHCCIVERRMVEKIEGGEARTDFLSPGETVRIEMLGADGRSIFGAIEQEVTGMVTS